MELRNRIKELSDQYHQDIVNIRRHLHSYPELSFQEYETSKFIATQLNEMGVKFRSGIVKTGIEVILEGKNPGKSVKLLRADIDALPILEDSSASYCSRNEGVMHACGHDVHTSSLLGAIKILNETKDQWEGTIKAIFQPGEERLPGGASLMIEEGILENPKPEIAIGQHVFPELPAGKVGFKPGMYMASADEVYVTVKGKGGHAAIPHLNIDPVLIASHVVVGLQQIISRNVNPEIPCVLSFGKIIGMGATNVIPNEVKLEGTFRTMNEEWRFEAHKRMKKMAAQIAEAMGGTCELEVKVGYPFLVNDEELTLKSKDKAIEYLGESNVVDLNIRMTGEDFAYFSQEMPGCFYRLGTASPGGGKDVPVHNSKFDIDEDALKTGMGLMAWLAV